MNYQTHKVGGLCAGALVGSILLKQSFNSNNLISTVILTGGSFIGSLLPDIDHTNSFIGHKMKITSKVINKSCGHRGLTHSPIVQLIIALVLLNLGNSLIGLVGLIYISFILGLLVGSFSHVILDSMTKAGVPLLYPFNKKKYNIARFTTGKHENFIRISIMVLTFIAISFIKNR